ncbi:GIY-YIG nuclease family protein [Streptomyces chartreusis]|uniref:GIY-YIG nuclease family protein n=1 Tax=Streptomyces chartreusis TaxID=1969 RepID=UPI0037147287
MAARGPRREYVYLMGSPGSPIVKIGRSNNPKRRLAQVQEDVTLPLQVLWTTPGGKEMEKGLHDHFAAARRYGEWFDLGFETAPALVAAVVTASTWETESWTEWKPRSTDCTGCGHGKDQHRDGSLCNIVWGWNPDAGERCKCDGYTLRRRAKMLPVPDTAELFTPSETTGASLYLDLGYSRAC